MCFDVLLNFSAEAVNNMGGLGFNGYDENGKAKWDGVTNANILKIEVLFLFVNFVKKVVAIHRGEIQ